MTSRLIGGILLIIGTSIGGSMLALPMATAAGGFMHSTLLFLGAWIIMTIGAFLILEVNLWLPEGTNLVSMAKATLGPYGALITWLVYLVLLYSLLSAYVAGGSDLLDNLLTQANVHLSPWLSAVLFTCLFGYVVSNGVRVVDIVNRGLMSTKLIAYVFLVALIMPHVDIKKLYGGHAKLLAPAVMMVITSFGYGTIIPTVRSYLKSDAKQLRIAIAIGSLIPLVCYFLWDMSVQGTLASSGPQGLISMAHSQHSVSELTTAISTHLGSAAIDTLAHVFTSICITTSFLGVALGLTDFLADGFHVKKRGTGKLIVMATAFLPPLLLVLFLHGIFLTGLEYAGICCLILLVILPCLMVWRGRYVKNMHNGFQLLGGKTLIATEFLIAIFLLAFGIFYL